MIFKSSFSAFLFFLSLWSTMNNNYCFAQMEESHRLEEYHKRNYTWPLPSLVPETPGWNRNLRRRLAQVERIVDNDDRYNAWVAIMTAALVAPNYTRYGWGLTRAPDHLVNELKYNLRSNLATAKEEYYIDVIETTNRPLFIPQPRLNNKVLNELLPMHEHWISHTNVRLAPSMAYGLRVYRNESVLHMHVDRLKTHVVSCILHVDHSEDSEPWPIFIEDFEGNTHEVVLTSGDMLFYESSKCIHGRPRKFIGSWYSSIFVHYHPVGWDHEQREKETHYAIPEHWHTAVKEPYDDDLPVMEMIGTSMKEPSCPDYWCHTKDTIQWQGPAKKGVVVSTPDHEAFQKEQAQGKQQLHEEL